MPLFLPGESPRTEEPGELQSVGLQSQTRLSDQAHGIPFMDRPQFGKSNRQSMDSWVVPTF